MITETLRAYKMRNFRQKNSFRDHGRPDWVFYTFKSVNFLIAYLSSLRCARLRDRARGAAQRRPGPNPDNTLERDVLVRPFVVIPCATWLEQGELLGRGGGRAGRRGRFR
jgi:hypothetical protein